MIIDLHIHIEGRSHCSHLSLQELYRGLSPKLDGICITDHEVIDKIRHLHFQEFSVFYGVELWSDKGDILAYGLKNILPSKDLRAKEIIDFIHHHNGIAVAAHPFSSRHNAFHESVYDYSFDAIEINGAIGKNENKLARQAAESLGLPLTGGSDAHSINQLNTVATEFENGINSIEDIVKAIKNKKCKPVRI
ncbi:MAG: hypothetical protein EU541_01370 [Promethearchaeota archaeon]|nr:MAG: hypothetical protein EU541_01370 [Candidatus Lokiarchaeota archaeon]